jgi:hypothetical protein
MKSYLLAFVVVFLLASTATSSAEFQVNLYSNEFALASPSDNVKICACSSRIDEFEVTNVGNIPSLFSVSTDSPINNLITLSSSSFSLNPGEMTKVHAAIAMPCAKEGAWTYTFNTKTNYGRVKTIQKPVVSQVCQNIKSVLLYFNKTVNPCESVPYELQIEYTASFADDYEVNLGQYDGYAKYSEKSVRLLPGEKKTIYIQLQLPCKVYGSVPLEFTIHSQMNNLYQVINYELVINRAYDYAMTLPVNQKICSQVVTKIPVALTNNAGMPNDYTIELQAPLFVSLAQKTATLNPGETLSTELTLSPKVSDEGQKTVAIQVTPGLGGLVKESNMNLTVEHCYEHHVAFATALEKACCGKKTYSLNVRNNGMYEETFYLKLKSPMWAQLSQDTVTLQPGENKDLSLDIDVPCIDDQFEIKVIAEAASTGLVAEDILTLHSLTTQSCRKIKVLNDNIRIDEKTGNVDLIVQNQGIEDGTYSVAYTSEFFSTATDALALAAGESKNISLDAHNLAAYNAGVYLDELTMDEQTTGQSYTETVKVTLGQRSIFLKFFDHVFSSPTCFAFFILGIVCIILAIILLCFKGILDYFSEGRALYFRRVPYSDTAATRIIIVFLVIFIVLFAIAWAISSQKQYKLVQKSLYFEMWEGSTLTIDAGNYFEDPDNDTLMYRASTTENIAFSFNQNKATITPDQHFYGERIFTFTADDGKDGIAESAVITLKVIPRPKYTLGYVFTHYCPLFFIGAIFILWLIVLSVHIKKGRIVWYYREKKR